MYFAERLLPLHEINSCFVKQINIRQLMNRSCWSCGCSSRGGAVQPGWQAEYCLGCKQMQSEITSVLSSTAQLHAKASVAGDTFQAKMWQLLASPFL
jgi:hypothetical protein